MARMICGIQDDGGLMDGSRDGTENRSRLRCSGWLEAFLKRRGETNCRLLNCSRSLSFRLLSDCFADGRTASSSWFLSLNLGRTKVY